MAEKQNERSKRYKETYVFYAHSIPFHGHTIRRVPLGGSESAVVYMARALQRKGKKVVVFTATEEPGRYDGVEYASVTTFLHYIQRNIIDVFIAVRDGQVLDLPIHARLKLLWMHDAHDQPHVQCLKDPAILGKIDKIITISAWQTAKFREVFSIPEEKIFESRNGICKKYFRKYSKKRKKQLVYTSTPFRGLDILLECFPYIREQVPAAELAVFSSMKVYGMSDKEDKEKFGDIYEQCAQPGVTLYGSVCQEELARKLAQASLFVYPNCFPETACIAALEAQAAGLPCIAAKLGALEETIADGVSGTLIDGDVRSPEFKWQFIQAIVHYLNDESLWNTRSMAARERVLPQYEWDTIADEWINELDRSKPRLSLCMIVRNEEQRLAECLDAVQHYVDEIILVDTGSDDKTLTIARQYDTVKIFTYTWNNDFSRPRNFSLHKASGDWILVLDADERIAARDFLHLRKLLNMRNVVAYKLLQRSYTNDTRVAGWKANDTAYREGAGYTGYHDSYLVRLFRNGYGFKFEGRVHETVEESILRQDKLPTNTDMPIHHFGKTGVEEKEQHKGALYCALGKQKVADKKDKQALRELAIQYAEMGRDEDAFFCYEKVLSLDPGDAVSLSNIAVLYMKKGDYESALDKLQQAITANTRYIPAYINGALAYKEKGSFDSAKELLLKALALDKKQPLVWKELGIIESRKGQYGAACDYFRKVEKMSKADYCCDEVAFALYKVGCALFANNDVKQAIRYFDEALEIKSVFPEAMNKRGVAYVRSNDFEKARKQFHELISVCTVDRAYRKFVVIAYTNLGYIENYESNFTIALTHLTKAVELDHTDPEALNHLGIAQCGLGDLDAAIHYFEAALSVNPYHQGARINIQRVRELLVKEHNERAEQKSVKHNA